jgi:hypothetical protein
MAALPIVRGLSRVSPGPQLLGNRVHVVPDVDPESRESDVATQESCAQTTDHIRDIGACGGNTLVHGSGMLHLGARLEGQASTTCYWKLHRSGGLASAGSDPVIRRRQLINHFEHAGPIGLGQQQASLRTAVAIDNYGEELGFESYAAQQFTTGRIRERTQPGAMSRFVE